MTLTNPTSNNTIFTTMGMFIIDDIYFPEYMKLQPQLDVIGGGGTWAILGARVFCKAPIQSKKLEWIIDIGSDFPQSALMDIEKWNTGVILRDTPERKTTRGWNMYAEREHRDFKYLAPKKRIEVDDWIANSSLLSSQSYHLICSPNRFYKILSRLSTARKKNIPDEPEPFIVWEPVPNECIPENLEMCLSSLDYVDILSPNAEEAASFFGLTEPDTKPEIEKVGEKFLPYLTKTKGDFTASICIRAGKQGCVIMNSTGYKKWFPAYHSDSSKVIDPTGGGNSFIGGFSAGLVLSNGDLETAAIYGNVAAGLAIEQIGTPKLEYRDGEEIWNGISGDQRIHNYRERLHDYKA